MEFALNYSPQAADLVQREIIHIDRFKCPPWPDMIAAASALRPVYVHFNLVAGAGQDVDWKTIIDLCAQTHTHYVNLHLAPAQRDFPDMAVDTSDLAEVAAITARMIDDVRRVVEQVGAERVIVENVPIFPKECLMLAAVRPDVIRRVVEETGCGFLLDISHARFAAWAIGMDEYDYLSLMPGEVLRELHMTGIGRDETGAQRDHMPITDKDWPFLEWVLARISSGEWANPWGLAFEYGGIGPKFEWRSNAVVMAEQVPRLVELVSPLA